MSIEISPKSFFEQPSVADMRLIACTGAEELTGLIDKHLVRWAKAAGIEKDKMFPFKLVSINLTLKPSVTSKTNVFLFAF